MTVNWSGAKSYYTNHPYLDKKPIQTLSAGMVHEKKDQAVFVEELADKYAIFVVEKDHPYDVIAELQRGIEHRENAKEQAENWAKENPDGYTG